VVDIDSFCKRLNVVLLGAIEVTHLKFKLEAFEIVEVLPEMVLLKKLKSEPLLLFHEEKSLVILDSITKVSFLTKNSNKLFHLFFNFLDFVVIACWSQIFLFQLKVERHSFLAASIQSTQVFHVVLHLANYDIDLECHKLLHKQEVTEVRYSSFLSSC
jgi:hypothetical protein